MSGNAGVTSANPTASSLKQSLTFASARHLVRSDPDHSRPNHANLNLIDPDRFVDLFLGSYENLSADMRHRFPLKQVYSVAGTD